MGGVSEAATSVVEKALASKPLRIKILTKKPVISACELSKQVPVVNSMEKLTSTGNESTSASGNRKLNNSIVGTKRRLEGGVECEKEKGLNMDRYATSNCKVILGKLIKHRYGFPFKKPVDPVELGIPDYFDIIQNPMDLGTIKQNLDDNKYRDAEEFEFDVRLTFSNAILYNPPDNCVHKYAKELMAFFDHLWKPLKAKMNRQRESIKQLSSQRISDETTHDADRKCLESLSSLAVRLPGQTTLSNEIDPGELTGISIKKKLKVIRHCESVKQFSSEKVEETTDNVGQKHLKSSSSHVDKFPGKTMLSIRKDPEQLTKVSVKKEEKINRLEETMKSLSSRKIFDEMSNDASRKCLKSPLSLVDKLPAQAMLSEVKDPQELIEVSIKKKVHLQNVKDVKDVNSKSSTSSKICRFDTDTGGENSENMHARPFHSVVKVKCENAKNSTLRKVSRNETKVVEVKKSSTPQQSGSDLNAYGDASFLNEEDVCTTSGDVPGKGLETVLDTQLSPSKALRAAILKSRFADTILKAQLQHGGRTDLVKLQREKERLERMQWEEKAKIEAQIRAAESAARTKAESELKRRREQERVALEKMEQSVDLDDNFHVLRELEALIGRPLFVLCKCRDGRSQAVYSWDQIEADELRSPLEQLGLFIKAEYMAGDDDEAALREEGEWEEGEVVF